MAITAGWTAWPRRHSRRRRHRADRGRARPACLRHRSSGASGPVGRASAPAAGGASCSYLCHEVAERVGDVHELVGHLPPGMTSTSLAPRACLSSPVTTVAPPWTTCKMSVSRSYISASPGLKLSDMAADSRGCMGEWKTAGGDACALCHTCSWVRSRSWRRRATRRLRFPWLMGHRWRHHLPVQVAGRHPCVSGLSDWRIRRADLIAGRDPLSGRRRAWRRLNASGAS